MGEDPRIAALVDALTDVARVAAERDVLRAVLARIADDPARVSASVEHAVYDLAASLEQPPTREPTGEP